MTSLLFSLLIAAALPGAAPAEVPPAAAAEDPKLAVARELTEIVNSKSHIGEQIDALLGNMATQAFAADPSLTALNQEYPGADRVFVDALRPILADELERNLPSYNAEIAGFFADNFTAPELDELLAFWRSPPGLALVESMSGSIDYGSTAKEIADQVTDGAEFEVSGTALERDKRRAAVAGIGKLSPAHRTAVMRFGLTPTGRKLAKLGPQRAEIDRRWANREPSAEAQARIEEEVTEALLGFMASEDKRRAAATE